MAFPPSDLCIQLPEIPSLERVCLPGGVCFDYTWSQAGTVPNIADMAVDYIAKLGPAMAPLQPFFQMLDVVIQIFKCLKAIPDAITTLNPTDLLECIPTLAELIDQLLSLIPQVSVPKMVIAAIKNVSALLRGVATEFIDIQRANLRIAEAIDRAASLGDVQMSGFLVCAQGTVEKSAESLAAALQGIGQFILLINLFMSLFGGPEIPCFGSLVSDNLNVGLDVVIDLLLSMADILDDIANAIPDPDLAFSLVLGDAQC